MTKRGAGAVMARETLTRHSQASNPSFTALGFCDGPGSPADPAVSKEITRDSARLPGPCPSRIILRRALYTRCPRPLISKISLVETAPLFSLRLR